MIGDLIGYLLSAVGLTVVIVWPEDGPGAFIRERVLRPILPGTAKKTLDCYICLGFWSGLAMSALWWTWDREPWLWTGPLMVSGAFWLILKPYKEGR